MTTETHGMWGTPEYSCWSSMISRCENPNDQRFKKYGQRGIRVCSAWRNSFEVFFADMGARPSTEHSIDRYPNNNGDYQPGNCRWATVRQQNRNRRSNTTVDYHGENICLTELCERLGVSYSMVRQRMKKRGMSLSEALSTPVKGVAQMDPHGITPRVTVMVSAP